MNLETLRQLFAENADSKEAEKMAAYMRGNFAYFGLPTPKRRMFTKQFFAAAGKTDTLDWQFIFDCFDADERECQYAALDYLQSRAKKLTAWDIPKLKELIENKSWWDTVDALDQIIGNIALKDSSVNKLLLEWSVDGNFWLRRIAIDHQLGRKDKTDTALLEEIIKNNLGQEEFFINKAIGWSLREYAKTNPEWVKDFINRYRDRLAKLSIKEAEKHFTE